jgi:lipopolysaccharide transport system ATP-binding protein
MKPIIEVKGISKKYKVGHHARYLSLRDAITDFFKFNNRETIHGAGTEKKGARSFFWALDDINFEVQAGESIGIIGRNGAGKSTLLKILSRITPPTKGSAILRGRLASLLEVGTGFHPELTGRDNVFMNGSILGLRRAEIMTKFDEILAFSGIEKFIDMPLKHYSSGMQLRLAFAVAAYLEPEILVIDEVLAVGDAEFQKRCLGKMDEVSRSGRTVLFVSHNLNAIQSLCKRSILLEKGCLIGDGSTSEILNQYLRTEAYQRAEILAQKKLRIGQKLWVKVLRLKNGQGILSTQFSHGEKAHVEIEIEVLEAGYFYNFSIEVYTPQYGSIFTTSFMDTETEVRKKQNWQIGQYMLSVELPLNLLREGQYSLRLGAARPKIEVLDIFEQELFFTYLNPQSPTVKISEGRQGAILPVLDWRMIKI